MFPLVHILNSTKSIESKVCITAQHKQMLDQVLGLFKIKPDFDLNMQEGQALVYAASNVIKGVGQVIGQMSPGLLLVHGEITTTMAAALAGFYSGIQYRLAMLKQDFAPKPVYEILAGFNNINLIEPL